MNLENVGYSAWDPVGNSLWDSVMDSVGGSVSGPVDDSVRVSAVQETQRHLKERI